MVDTAVSHGLVRVAMQAVGRIGACCDGANDLRSWTVMTGGAGTGPVGGDIMLSTINLRPGCDHMTAAAGSPVRKVSGTSPTVWACPVCVASHELVWQVVHVPGADLPAARLSSAPLVAL